MTTAPLPTRQRPTGWIVATCVLAVVAIALAVVVLTADGDETVGTSADSSARAACELIGQVPEDGFEMTGDGDDYPPDMSRLAASETLLLLASAEQDGYDDLYETVQKPRLVASQEFDATGDEFVDALADARDACGEEDL